MDRPYPVHDPRTMWEVRVTCKACEQAHTVCADVRPRVYAFECPRTGERVDMPFRDPTRIIEPWSEVASCSPESIAALFTEEQGKF